MQRHPFPFFQLIRSSLSIEPITLFGETHLDRARRLKKLERMLDTDIDDGQRHDFGKILASLQDEGDAAKLPKQRILWSEMVPSCPEEEALFWIRQMLQEWEMDLDARPEEGFCAPLEQSNEVLIAIF
jgi:hypothetical protein